LNIVKLQSFQLGHVLSGKQQSRLLKYHRPTQNPDFTSVNQAESVLICDAASPMQIPIEIIKMYACMLSNSGAKVPSCAVFIRLFRILSRRRSFTQSMVEFSLYSINLSAIDLGG